MTEFRVFAIFSLVGLLWLLRGRDSRRALWQGLCGRAGSLPLFRLLLQMALMAALVLLISGLAQPVFTGGEISGYWLILHLLAAPVFAFALLKMVFYTAARHQPAEDEAALVRAIALENRRDLRAFWTPALRLRALYWLALVLVTLAMTAAAVRMFAVGDTALQIRLADWHRYSAVLFFLLGAGYVRVMVRR